MTNETLTEDNIEPAATDTEVAETEQTRKSNPNQEAAKYRVRLREAEAQRDALMGERDNLARQIVEAQLPVNVTSDLFWQIHSVSEFIVDGAVDLGGVQAACTAMVKRFHLTSAPYVPNQQGSTGWEGNSGSSLEQAFSPRRDT